MQFNYEMLRLARQLKGFPQTDAAKRLGIDQSVLSRMESGLLEPREEVLAQAEKVYDVRQSFFYQNDAIYGAPVSVHPMWRRKADVTSRELDLIVAEMNVRLIHLRRFLEAAEVGKTHTLPRLDIEEYGHAERVAATLRAHWMLPRGPINNLTILLERAGVVVAHSPMGGASVSGVNFAPPGMPPMILLNSDQPSDRMRFTLAHELGHLVMHRVPSPTMETEANEFASSFLLPSADIGPLLKIRKIDLQLLATLKPEWKVSMQSILMRAKSLGLLSRNQEEYLWKQISARKWRVREPPELDFPKEKPTVIENLVEVFRKHLNYTDDELSKLLHVFDSGLQEFYPRADIAQQVRTKFRVVN